MLLKCLAPIRVYNKYLNEYVYTSCGKCAACKKKRASKWVSRLENEREKHKFAFFFTLTWSNTFLPLLYPDLSFDDEQLHTCIFKKETLFRSKKDGICVPFKDFIFSEKKDLSYFHRAFGYYNGIPYASKSDVQLFLKRLNKYFYDNVTGKYQNFRYFIVSELGSTTFRPHFHGIFFVDDERVANAIQKGICQSWQKHGLSLGRVDCQLVKSAACSYVAQYLNQLFNYPSFYEKSEIRPFYLCSRRPFIGNDIQSDETLQKVFDSGTTKQVVINSKKRTSFVAVPLQSYVENYLYPKFSFFDKVSDTVRIRLYQSCRLFVGKYGYQSKNGLKFFIANVKAACLSIGKYQKSLSDFWAYLCDICLNEDCDERLKKLYYVSRRFLLNCAKFALSEFAYYNKIVDYFKRKELEKLKSFYDSQVKFSLEKPNNLAELVVCYPDTCYRRVVPLEKLGVFRDLLLDSGIYLERNTKSHFKNAYFDSLKYRKLSLYNLIKSYNNA